MAAERTFKLTFIGDAKKALSEMGRLDKGMGSLGQRAKTVGKGVGLAMGGAAVAGIGAAIKSAADFEAQFAEVQTLLPNMDTSGIAALRKEVLETSKEFGVATDKVVPAFYQAISAGVPPDNIAEFMSVATKASIGGVTELETAVDGITSVVNAYGAEVIDAQRAADVMFTGVKLGKTDFEQLSATLFNVIPTAASLGVSFEEVTAALATMTAQGVPTSVATTQLRQAFVEASKSGTKLDKAIKELNEKSFAELIAGGSTASEIFQGLRESMPEQEFKDLFGSVEAMNAVLQITGPNAEAMASAMAEMENSAGAVDEAFRTVSDTVQYKFDKALNNVKVLLIEIGAELLPLVEKFLDVVLKVPTPVLAIGLALGGLAVTVGVLVAALAPLAILFSPTGAIVLGIAAVIAAGVLLWQNWDTVKEKAGQLWTFITGKFEDILGWFRSNWPEIATLISGPFAPLVALATDAFGLRSALEEAFGAVASWVGDKVGDMIEMLDRFVAAVGRAKDAIGSIPTPGDVAGKLPGSGSGAADAAGFILGKVNEAVNPVARVKGLLGFDSGGIVPGPIGSPRLVMAHGGETILPTHRRGGGGTTVVVNVNGGTIIGNSHDFERAVTRALNDARAKGGF